MTQKIWKRSTSFALVAAVYILTIAAGLGVYVACPGHFAVRLLIADATATLLVFLFSLLFRNASVYDPYWSVQPPVILTVAAAAILLRGGTVTPSGLCLTLSVWLWAIRLTANWAYTFRGLDHQDWRYTLLRERTGALYPIINLLGIHLVPTLVVYGCVLPAVYVLRMGWDAPLPAAVFSLLAILAATLQGAADIQMHAFRRRGTGGFIREGVWHYSRHPSYLGEILMWWCIGLGALCAAGTWRSWPLLIGPAANTMLFLCVSIPLADRRQAQKPGWPAYKRATRMLLPIHKRP